MTTEHEKHNEGKGPWGYLCLIEGTGVNRKDTEKDLEKDTEKDTEQSKSSGASGYLCMFQQLF